ncbi:MAG: arginine--tRNA ligase [Bacteroidetes bacterium]|nr:arginine--tRNA ligase [Bacteroidota bacterium]
MLKDKITKGVQKAFSDLYGKEISLDSSQVQKTRKEFEGDFTINVFPFLKFSGKSPEVTASEVGNYLATHMQEVQRFNVIKGFLNIVVSNEYWIEALRGAFHNLHYGLNEVREDLAPVVIEFSSPNTNKPLHLGHVRNNLLGWSIAKILQANGHKVVKVNLVNDRGIHICKTMLAWNKWANGALPDKTGEKGDKFVGNYYVQFDKELKKEINDLKGQGLSDDEAEKSSDLMMQARKMLQDWEHGDKETRALWQQMNQWVYDGFEQTYHRMGIDFDKTYYESDTYLLGKEIVMEGINSGAFYKIDDGSVWCDLSGEGLDKKLLLRSDGTSVYMTQDLGTAQLRYDDYHPGKLLYVVGNEQNYHFDVLRLILKKLGREWAGDIIHISYGMVELPSGRMKSREGTVVDADDLMDEMNETAARMTSDLGKAEFSTDAEANAFYTMIGMGALKYYILKVDPRKNMLFNPEESVDFNGNTGPFIQYTHARIRSLLAKAGEPDYEYPVPGNILDKERSLMKLIWDYPNIVQDAGEQYSPALIANYAFDLAKEFNQFYQEIPVLRAENEASKNFRLILSATTGKILKSAMNLLGIDVPDRM